MLEKFRAQLRVYENSDTVKKPWKGNEKPVKTPWKGREKHWKTLKIRFVQNMQKEWFCDFVTNFSHKCSRSIWLLLILRRVFFFKVMIFLRPLVIEVLYSNGRVKLVLWTDWVSSFSWCFGQLPPSFSFHFARCSVRPRFVLAPSAAKQTKREPRNKQRLERWDRVNYISRNSD